MLSARRGVSGDDCVRAAFPAAPLSGLADAVGALERAHPSAVVPVLVASLNPYHWRASRSAVAGLREQGRAGLRAAPAVAGWLKLCVDNGVTADQQDGINDALHRLSRLRADLDDADPVTPPAALDRVRRFFDEVVQPYLLTLLVPPVRYWQRGIVGYLDALNGDLEAVAAALTGFAGALREHTWGSGTNSDWDEYTHGETVALIGKLGPHLDRLRVERDWLAQSTAEPPPQPATAETPDAEEAAAEEAAAEPAAAEPAAAAAEEAVSEPAVSEPAAAEPALDERDAAEPAPAVGEPALPERSIAWAQQELAAPSVSRRLAACRLLRQFGFQARPAVPMLRAMLAQLDGAAPAAVAELREEALMTLRAIDMAPEPADDADAGEAGDRLLALAGEDPDPSVRTTALHAIADAGVPIAGALAVALHAATAHDPGERAGAARLLATLVR